MTARSPARVAPRLLTKAEAAFIEVDPPGSRWTMAHTEGSNTYEFQLWRKMGQWWRWQFVEADNEPEAWAVLRMSFPAPDSAKEKS